MPVQSSPILFITDSHVIHLGGLTGLGIGTIVFTTNGPLHFGGSPSVTSSGPNRGALFPAGFYRYEISGNDDLYAIAPAGHLVTVEGLSLADASMADEIVLHIGPAETSPLAVPSPYGESAWLEDQWGNELDLTTIPDEQYKQGLDGRFLPGFVHQIDTVPGVDGGIYRQTVATLGTVTLPLLLVGNSTEELRSKQRALGRGLNPKRGPQTLHIVTLDGVHSTLPVIFENGLQADPATSGEEVQTLVSITFRCLAPYWSDTIAVAYSLTKQVQSTTFFPLSFPIHIGPSSVFRRWTEQNPGDVETPLICTVRGYGRDFAFVNDDTGESISVEGTIEAGQAIILDGLNKTVEDQLGNDLFPVVTGDFWDLGINSSRITAQLLDASDDASLSIYYVPRRVGA